MTSLRERLIIKETFINSLTESELEEYQCRVCALTHFSYCDKHGNAGEVSVPALPYRRFFLCGLCIDLHSKAFANDKTFQAEQKLEIAKKELTTQQHSFILRHFLTPYDTDKFCAKFMTTVHLLKVGMGVDFANFYAHPETHYLQKVSEPLSFLSDKTFDLFYHLFSKYVACFRKHLYVADTETTNQFLGLQVPVTTSKMSSLEVIPVSSTLEHRFKNFLKKVQPELRTFIYLPFLANGHWVLFKIDVPGAEITVYDSLCNDDIVPVYCCDAVSLIKKSLRKVDPDYDQELTVKISDYNPQQDDGNNCGYFVIHHLLREVFSKDLFTTKKPKLVHTVSRAFVYYQIFFGTFPFTKLYKS